jgi:hypothetical protein
MPETWRVSRQNKNFGYLMHLVGYLYEDYHDARSLEHKVGKYGIATRAIDHSKAHAHWMLDI